MDIGVEISLYPLKTDFIPLIHRFLERLSADSRFRVVTNSMSTQVFGSYEDVFGTLQKELRDTFEQVDAEGEKAVFVMKVFGPLRSG